MALRLKGQEVEVRIIKAGVLQDTITKIKNFELEVKLDLLEEDFLGMTTTEYDEVYSGVGFSFEMQLDSPDFLDLQRAIIDKARRITPDVQYTITGTLLFPSGATRALIIPDAHFGAQPINAGGRKEYVTVSCEGAASDYTIQSL
jgi:hypothetical protein